MSIYSLTVNLLQRSVQLPKLALSFLRFCIQNNPALSSITQHSFSGSLFLSSLIQQSSFQPSWASLLHCSLGFLPVISCQCSLSLLQPGGQAKVQLKMWPIRFLQVPSLLLPAALSNPVVGNRRVRYEVATMPGLCGTHPLQGLPTRTGHTIIWVTIFNPCKSALVFL